MAEVTKTGIWVDTRTGKVVRSEPVEGRLLAAPGSEITPQLAAAIDAEGEEATAPPAVETATTSTRKSRKA